jgi:hypothetical protein
VAPLGEREPRREHAVVGDREGLDLPRPGA